MHVCTVNILFITFQVLNLLPQRQKWYFVSLFSSNSCGKQLEKRNELLFCIFKLENGGQKQANGSRDSFRPEAKPRVGMVRGCHLPAWDPHFSTRKYKITRIWFFKCLFATWLVKKWNRLLFLIFSLPQLGS